MFLFQVFVNSAMAMGIAPITGIPLPFVSVGGSSMLTNFLAIGILQAIYMRRNVRQALMAKLKSKVGPMSVVSLARARCGAARERHAAARGRGRARAGAAPRARAARGWRSGARSSSRTSTGAAALIWVGAADEDAAARCRSRAKIPIVAVTDAETVPYVLADDLVRVPPGQGFPVDEIAAAVARRLGDERHSRSRRGCRCCAGARHRPA